jgi:phage internal scaffolding protein
MTHQPRIRRFYEREPQFATIGDISMTQQHMKDECDINNIMAKYQKTGLITHVAKYQGIYDDFTVMPDFKTAMDTMMDAQEMFLSLPSDIREKFDNDAGAFVEFATDSRNYDEMVDLGLVPIETQLENTRRNDHAASRAEKKRAKKAPPKKAEKTESSDE